MNKLYHITFEKERVDTLKLVDIIKADGWVDPYTIFVTCSPDYSSFMGQIINHKLSYLNKNELYENLFLEMPYPIMSQVWNRETSEIISFDKYLVEWTQKYIGRGFKYLFLDSATIRGKNFSKLRAIMRDKAEFKLASLYVEDKAIVTPDYYVEKYDSEEKGNVIFEWENDNNPNWNY